MIDTAKLREAAQSCGISLEQETAEKLDLYAQLLVEWNEKMNLTAITAPDEIVMKHFVDSLTAGLLLPPAGEEPLTLVDVGTGAGFPGVPLALWRPDIRLTLLDSLNKRLVFLDTVCRELGLPAALVHARAEEAGRRKDLRERFTVATARAVAALPTLCEYCLPLVKPGGSFIAMKGPSGPEEAAASANALSRLGGEIGEVRQLQLPSAGEDAADGDASASRTLILLRKISPTPAAYPRASAKIAKQPL